MNTNGCGACKGFWKWFKPPHHRFYQKDCDKHDYLYNIGGDKYDRKMADYILHQNMVRTTRQHFYKRKWFSKQWFLFLSLCYYIGVRIGGKNNFNYE